MNKTKTFTTFNMVMIAMFTAILSILSQIAFQLPGGIPLTLQTFGVVLIGVVLGNRYGFYSVLLYLLLGAVGVPVFANFNGGLQVLVSSTGGYLIGFLPMVFLAGLGGRKSFSFTIFTSITGLLVCHILGLYVYYLNTHVWILPSVPLMLAKDIIASVMAIIMGREIQKRLSFISFPAK